MKSTIGSILLAILHLANAWDFRECGILPVHDKIHNRRAHSDAVFDGNRYIYIFGGIDVAATPNPRPEPSREVLRYDTETQKASHVTFFPEDTKNGMAIRSPLGDIFYLGGKTHYYGGPYKEIYKLNAEENRLEKIEAELKVGRSDSTAVVVGDCAYIFAGYTIDYDNGGVIEHLVSVEEFNMTSLTITEVARLPEYFLFNVGSIYDGKHIYLLAEEVYTVRIIQIDPITFEMKEMGLLPSDVTGNSPVVTNIKNSAYTLLTPRFGYSNPFAEFNPEDGSTSVISTAGENFRALGGTTVFVEKTNMFYIFGSDAITKNAVLCAEAS